MDKNLEGYTGFRPRAETWGEFQCLRELMAKPQFNKTFSAMINSLVPHLYSAVLHTTEYDEEGNPTIELNLGRITIK